ncbi:Spore maturation protein CgeB [Faunimonas pinastri]|uniref:Spore maturation protein CgeB n=1 Tax=Faunimonas pinastri TaxID=1855383 RepID=A0A1H9JXC4_9HYPH|nr:glycosyltransferase [Faunimonas pinastri]SEQ91586.1 Spore maturation protein CgeB [Faunimonas pinastri]
MQFAFFGSSLVSAYWNGAATYYRGLLKALAARGHSVAFYEPDAFERQAHRDIDDPDWARVTVFQPDAEGLQRSLDAAASADVVVKFSGVGVLDRELEQAVVDMKRPNRTVLFWDVDAPATLDSIFADPADPLRHQIPRYDAVMTYGGGEAVVSAYEKLGAKACLPIYNAVDPATHHRVEPEDRFRTDLAFLGNRLPDREARVEEFFLNPAAKLPERRFLLGGNGWADKPMSSNIDYIGHVYTRDHNALNSSALAVLNINRESMARYGASPPTRIFEAAGAAACIVTDAWEGIEQFLEPDREILLAATGDEVAAHVEALDPERARAIGDAACRRVLAAHTYSHRAEQLEAILEGREALQEAI